MKNKDKIKREALFLFAENGFDKTSVRDIARRVGIRESAIYNHYKSKKEIFAVLLEEAQKRLTAARFVNDEMMDKLAEPQIFLCELTEKIISEWSKTEDKAYTKLLIQAKFNSSLQTDFKLEDLFSTLRKLLNIIFSELKNYGYIRNFSTGFLVEEFLAPLIVLKFSFLINNFFEREQVLTYAKNYCKEFWKQNKNDDRRD